jgi:hypothetical protein
MVTRCIVVCRRTFDKLSEQSRAAALHPEAELKYTRRGLAGQTL